MSRSVATACLLAAACLLAPSAVAAPNGGRVVRVERHAVRGLGTPRTCQLSLSSMSVGQCFGHAVDVGETVTVLSTAGVIGQLRVTHVTPDTSCGTPSMWVVEGEWSPEPGVTVTGDVYAGVLDGGIDPRRAKQIAIDTSPSGRPNDSDYSAFDTDGDGSVDLAFDHYMCDAQGLPSQSMTAQCFEVWSTSGRGHESRRLRLDIVPQC